MTKPKRKSTAPANSAKKTGNPTRSVKTTGGAMAKPSRPKRSSAATTSSAVKQMKMSGYHHLTRAFEKNMIDIVLNNDMDFLDKLTFAHTGPYILAADPLRSIKNNAICCVAVFCRAVIDAGAPSEECYALSDVFINRIEELPDARSVSEYILGALRHYARILHTERGKRYSLNVTRAIHYVHSHLYEPLRVGEIAKTIHRHPSHLSRLFRAEVGISLSGYIRQAKIEEAKSLLENSAHSVTEISELLGYCSLSHFSREFSRTEGVSPRSYLATARLREPALAAGAQKPISEKIDAWIRADNEPGS